MSERIATMLRARCRWCLLACALLLMAVPAAAQEVVPTLRSTREAYSTPMSKAQLSEMLNRAISQHPGWALLRKDAGNNCPTPYPGISVSCDWVVHAGTRWGYDVLRDQEGAATIVESGGEAIGAGADLVYPWPVSGAAPSAPAPTTGAPTQGVPAMPLQIDYERLTRTIREEAVRVVLEQLQTDRHANEAQIASLTQQLDALAAQLRQHDEHPSWAAKVFGNRYVQLGMAGVGAWLGSLQAK